MKHWIVEMWYKKRSAAWAAYILLPISFVYILLMIIRRQLYRQFFQRPAPVPIIVVGNIVVGGVGKTPVVIALANQLQEKGLRVGIVSRGNGARCTAFPCIVTPESSADVVGDEPLLITLRTGCPVVID